ncbi:hypothetical protein [Pseudoalteromonas sp. G4]|jgi:hypothetical protein|uniref:hypothetical protein n=1 Tax=Pseudoalteromonas sp. G4 TaxID=2992761 RepID=UPI00237D49AA|nr:hypothetical protein [Pseudoalteromonas sp. G4]MDE3270663.1 hypothetical protein [Pseudoalteromonas sp. G4]
MKKRLLTIFTLLFLTACSEPLPEERMNYAGEWVSKEMYLLILPDGTVSYKRLKGGGSTEVNGPLKEFQGDDFVVGIGFLTSTFDVSEPPYIENDQWVMTVDGVKLTKREE